MPRTSDRPRETVVQSGVLAILKKAGAWWLNVHGDDMQAKTCDVIALYRGDGLMVECKRPGEAKHQGSHRLISPDPYQEHELHRFRLAGGWAAVVEDPAVLARSLAAWPSVCRKCLTPEGECDCDEPANGTAGRPDADGIT